MVNGMKKEYLFALIIFVAALIFFSIGLTSKSIWYDETLSLIIAGAPLKELFNFLHNFSPHPPAYFMFLKPLVHTNSLFLWRFLSVIFASAGALALFLIFRKKIYVAVPIVTVYIIAPLSLYYAQEIRMYAMEEGLFALILWSLLRYEEEGEKNIYLIFLLFVSIIFALTHYFSLLLLPGLMGGIFFYAIATGKWRKNINILFVLFIAFMAVFSWYLSSQRAIRMAQEGGRIWHLSLRYYMALPSRFWGIPRIVGILFSVVVVGSVLFFLKKESKKLVLWLFIFVFLTPFVIFQLKPPRHWLNPRYFIAILPLFLVTLGWFVEYFLDKYGKKRKVVLIIAGIVVIVLTGFSLKKDLNYFPRDKHAWKAVIKDYVEKYPGAVFVFNPPYTMASLVFNLPVPIEEKLILFKIPNYVFPWRKVEIDGKYIFIGAPSFVLSKRIFTELKNKGFPVFLISTLKNKGLFPEKVYRPIEGRLYVYRLN